MLRKLIVPALVILAAVAGWMAYRVIATQPVAAARTPALAAPLAELPPDPLAIRILFVGNSFVFVNDLPTMLKGLASSDGMPLETKQHTPGGAQLAQQAANAEVQALLRQRWDHVVLQEQSQLPALDEHRREETEPAIRTFMGMASATGSPVALFETWGYRDGDLDNVKPDTYLAMQTRLDEGFRELVSATGIDIVPVNKAWRTARSSHPEIELWGGDGRHPAPAGTYLAACVFYHSLLHKSPVGNKFLAGLSPKVAATLQQLATSN